MIEKLTIREILNEKEKLQNDLRLYLDKKKINYYKTQPGSPSFKAIVQGKNDYMAIFDTFSHFAIQDEKYDSKIYELQETINTYERYIISEMKRISKIDPKKVKIYLLREDEKFIQENDRKRTWLEISESVSYSDRQCRRFYYDIVNGNI